MYEMILTLTAHIGITRFNTPAAYAVIIFVGAAGCFVTRGIIRYAAETFLSKAMERGQNEWAKILIGSLFVKRASNIVIPVIIYQLVNEITERHVLWDKIAEISFVFVMLLIIYSCLKSIGMIYGSYEASKNFPIHGILQVVTVAATVFAVLTVVSILIDQNPAVLFGSVGAVTAIITLVFRDAILGFVAGIQLTTNNMIRIDDWIEAPNHLANGLVTDITMTTVKVENFDKTIVSIPAYSLISESFINWRGMLECGARRMKRPFYIDAAKVRICDNEMIERFKKMALISNYIKDKLADIEEHNRKLDCDLNERVNIRCLTNIGVFRAYISEYLKKHPGIRQDLTQIVRHLDPGEKGIPMEIIAFVNATKTVDFDAVQSDIFDHLYAVISEFDLKLYQDLSSGDVREVLRGIASK